MLPTQLDLVDRQMRREALETFYSNAHFKLYDDKLGSTLSFLRDAMPREGLSQISRVKFIMTESHCICWATGTQRFDYKEEWRAVVALLSERANLTHLRITVSTSQCTSSLALYDGYIYLEGGPEVCAFTSIYDFYADVNIAMCSFKRLGGVNLELSVFEQLRPLLERDVLDCEKVCMSQSPLDRRLEEALRRLPRQFQVIPPWNETDRRLEGSNYHTDP